MCLSRNYDDYEELHLLLRQAQGRHFGIVVVRRENDPTRDLTPKGHRGGDAKVAGRGRADCERVQRVESLALTASGVGVTAGNVSSAMSA